MVSENGTRDFYDGTRVDCALAWVAMKLKQDQVWKQDDEYIRITRLGRLEVGYKTMKDVSTKEGTHYNVTKKEFCRLIKGASLLSPDEL